MTNSESWEQRAAARREELYNAIPAEWRLKEVPSVEAVPDATEFVAQHLSEEERRITDLSLETLCPALAAGLLTSREVTLAFAHRAALAEQLTHCLTEFVLDDALKRADELDAHLRATGKPVGPLHGVPVSLKDLFHLEGTYASIGFVAWLDKKSTREDEHGTVRILRDAGAVFFVKTNLPTSMMCGETVNNIFGFTGNAHKRICSAAGSSGGEGTLLALRGAPLGMGSDIGGSIRLPSCVNGVWGLKSTPGRLPHTGMRSINQGQTLVPSVVGPMANSLRAIEMCMKLLLAGEPWLEDPSMIEMPWRPCMLPSKLTLGVMMDDGIVQPQPPVQHALKQVVAALEKEGHEIVPFEPPTHSIALALWLGIMSQNGGVEVHDLIDETGEPLIEEVAAIYGAQRGDREPLSVEELYSQVLEFKQYCKDYEQAWNETAKHTRSGRMIDGVLMPTSGVVCWERLGTTYPGYTPPANVLHFTALNMPLARAEPIPKEPRDTFMSSMDEEVYEAYDPEFSKGMPVGIQLMGRRFNEEKVLAMADVIASACSPIPKSAL